ncbi:MAG: rRNA pseudouridine synthase [Clostridiales Family XIII bacterium]|jgi:23S rRNA pseudouridine2605 synthase|nr:rRNA pseudouridine synthase [Clostridiales Family XIII bacterium]
MRINKYISQAGICSRRKADALISDGNVTVNGVPVGMGYDVAAGDVVMVNGRKIEPEKKRVYIALNKPKGFITTTADEKDRPTVMEFVRDIGERIVPVGRLDGPTTGLLIMSNDGDFINKLLHPKHELPKTYRARVSGSVSNERLAKLRRGVDIGGYVTAPAKVSIIKQSSGFAICEITIHEGKNRQIRKMFASVGNKVLDLERVSIGDVRLGGLKAGHYRKLTQQEIKSLSGD